MKRSYLLLISLFCGPFFISPAQAWTLQRKTSSQSRPLKPVKANVNGVNTLHINDFSDGSGDEARNEAVPISVTGKIIKFGNPVGSNSFDCDVFVDPRSQACLGPAEVRQPRTSFERFMQQGAGYVIQYTPSIIDGNLDLAGVVQSEVTRALISSSVGYANTEIQKIPFFSQTTLSISAASSSDISGSLDSFMRLKTLGYDNEDDPMGLIFGQARATLPRSEQPQFNLGLGSRYRLGEEAMVGLNGFWDLRTTDYSTPYTRWGVGAEGFWKGFELRNNWYIRGSGDKDITIGGINYTERVVPGWDLEMGYRIPSYPQLAMFIRGFNWDYKDRSDNSGVEASLSWQATPHANFEMWVSNEIPAYPTDSNDDIDNKPGPYLGIRVRLTGRPVVFERNDTKQNLITQMTQPVRRRYDVLLERVKKSSSTASSFQNNVGGQ